MFSRVPAYKALAAFSSGAPVLLLTKLVLVLILPIQLPFCFGTDRLLCTNSVY